MTINIPAKFVKLCTEWHGGQDSMFYAISSTGDLSTGTYRPFGANTDDAWMTILLTKLNKEINECLAYMKGNKEHSKDIKTMADFSRFVDVTLEDLQPFVIYVRQHGKELFHIHVKESDTITPEHIKLISERAVGYPSGYADLIMVDYNGEEIDAEIIVL